MSGYITGRSFKEFGGGRIDKPEAVEMCFEYSENSEILKTIIDKYEFSMKVMEWEKYFDEDKEKRYISRVYIVNKESKKSINFRFGHSIALTEKIHNLYNPEGYFGEYTKNKNRAIRQVKEAVNNFLYTILSSIRIEYDLADYDLDEFCDTFLSPETPTSKKVQRYMECVEHSKKLQAFFRFNVDEMNSLPS